MAKAKGFFHYERTEITGWAAEPGFSKSIDVLIEVFRVDASDAATGSPVFTKRAKADLHRPDVPRNDPTIVGDNHGFSVLLPCISEGICRYMVRAKAMASAEEFLFPGEIRFYYSHSPLVYVGVADQWEEWVKGQDQWEYVREHADGFYVNFIEMEWMRKDPTLLARTALAFHNKSAYLESDMGASDADDRWYIDTLQASGFRVDITSLNYGWSRSRADNLSRHALMGGTKRPNLVQQGPWMIGGNIESDPAGQEFGRTNSDYRNWIACSDGCSTDGPMGIWVTDPAMKSGSISMVRYARSKSRMSMVMLCPYHDNRPGYSPGDFLEAAKQCVLEHEAAGAVPDIWAVFEYATTIDPVPEADNSGQPVNSTTGVAYWLLNHLGKGGVAPNE